MRRKRKPAHRPRRQTQSEAWEDFVRWCQGRELVAVPANPWTLAAYIRACEPHQTPRAIAKAVKEISQIHEEKTRKRIDRDPLVIRTLQMIETRRKVEKPKVDLFDEPPAKTVKKPKRRAATKKPDQPESQLKRGLSGTPRLVSRRRLSS